jgi:hypothetical protein
MSAFSNYIENALIDWLLRGQSFSPPATLYVALFTATPSDTGGGTEVVTVNTSYARVAIVASLANWAGTQAAGSTAASSGTGGTTSNNVILTFPTPMTVGAGGVNWGTIVAVGLFDASTAGNLIIWGPLSVSKAVNAGDPAPVFSAADLQFQIDN